MATEPGSSFSSGNPSNPNDHAPSDGGTRAAEVGRRQAGGIADQARSSAAAGLSSSASTLEDTANEGVKYARHAAQATANALSKSADYLRDNSAQDMAEDAMDVVKRYPGIALAGAVALGFFVGRAFSSRS